MVTISLFKQYNRAIFFISCLARMKEYLFYIFIAYLVIPSAESLIVHYRINEFHWLEMKVLLKKLIIQQSIYFNDFQFH